MKYSGLLLILFLASCSNQSDEIIYQTQNMNNTQKAILTVYPAELNVGDTYRVFILNSNEKLNNTGIVFVTNDWDNVLPRDTSKIKLRWIDSETLLIDFDKKLRILNQSIRTRDNKIIYQNTVNKE